MNLDWLQGLLKEIKRHRVEADALDTVVHHGDQTQPATLPPDSFIFSDEQATLMMGYKEEAVAAHSYEDFINLIEKICNEMQLNLMKESSKVAAVLNSYRREANLDPL